MSRELVARLRKARELTVEIGKFKFLILRPTDAEAAEFQQLGFNDYEVTCRQMHGWANVTENDVVGGGGSDAVTFTPELCRAWLADKMEWWTPIATRALAAWKEHRDQLDAAAKN